MLPSTYQMLTNALPGSFRERWPFIPPRSSSRRHSWLHPSTLPMLPLSMTLNQISLLPLTSPASLSSVLQTALTPRDTLWAPWMPQSVLIPHPSALPPSLSAQMPAMPPHSVALGFTVVYPLGGLGLVPCCSLLQNSGCGTRRRVLASSHHGIYSSTV